jgi:hypothetical protein
MPIAVKRYTSLMTGVPALTGQVGTLVALLDACLVTGFNTKSVSTAVQTAGIATVTTSTAHGYNANDVVAISGANEAAWNDEFRVLTATTNSFTFAIPSGTTSPATGTLSAKIAPLGWTKPFSGTNKAAYLPQIAYCQNYLRVLDDSTTPTAASGRWAKWRGYETMTDIDTGIGLFPTVAQTANALSCVKSSTSDATARHWWLAGDGGIFYLGIFWSAAGLTVAGGYAFGDINSLRAGDAYSTLLSAESATSDTLPSNPGAVNYFENLVAVTVTSLGKYVARSYNQTGSAVAAGMIGDNAVSTHIGYGGLAYPHPPDNGLLFAPVGVVETNTIRSRALPGLYQPLHTTPLNYLDLLTSIPDFSGRTFQAFDLVLQGASSRCQCLIDITGPWR